MKPQKLADLYKIPTDSKGHETTSKAELQDLYEKTGDEVFGHVLRMRSLTTVISNYIPNWAPGTNGRCHTTFHFGPPTGQVASRAPNLMNASKHTETGQEFRKIIRAPEGFIFVELDFGRHHIHTMAYAAEDPSYLKFAALDSHSIFGSWMVPDFPDISLTWGNDEIAQATTEFKKLYKQVRQKAKAPVLGNQLGLGPRKLFWQNRKSPSRPEGIESEAEAKKLQGILAGRFPKVEIAKNQFRERAHTIGYLNDEWGTIRWFNEVFAWTFNKRKQDWEKRPGAQFNEAVAQAVQPRAHGQLKWVNLQLAGLDLLERYGFITTIHDSDIFCCPHKLWENCIADVKPKMEQPCSVLSNSICPDGLVVRVEVKVGKNWGDYDAEINPDGLQEIH